MSRPRWARWVTRISLLVGIAALVFTVWKIGPATIAHYIEHIGWWWIVVIAMEVMITTLDALAIRAFLSPETHAVSFGSTLLAQLAGRAVNAVTPSGNLGEAVKVSVLSEFVSSQRAVATVLLYNVVGFAMELVLVALAAAMIVAFVPLPPSLRDLLVLTGTVTLMLAVGMFGLLRRGLLGSLVRALRRVRVISSVRSERWQAKLAPVDDRMRAVQGARRRDRTLGIAAVVASRLTSMALSYVVFHAVGGVLSLRFVALTTVGGFLVYLLSTLVPMGVGISEGGYWGLFRAIGENPARGVTMVIARRVTLVVYATIGLVLMTANETVRRARRTSEPG